PAGGAIAGAFVVDLAKPPPWAMRRSRDVRVRDSRGSAGFRICGGGPPVLRTTSLGFQEVNTPVGSGMPASPVEVAKTLDLGKADIFAAGERARSRYRR